ncbi:phytase [Flavisphingomonas formosensis]|uniref:phytase n=1 Tax=Flavisphingomonas formosensis TaxID=861534 RepID=UPI0012FB324F|nr:phytase [Sphingomonas formosensis]
MRGLWMLGAVAAATAACAPAKRPAAPVADRIAAATPAREVHARAETVAVATAHADAADDPAIWRNPTNPAASLVIGTDKKAGIYVYGLDGAKKSFLAAGDINNADLRDGVTVNGAPAILVGASDRTDRNQAKLALFTLDPQSATLTRIGTLPVGAGEAYGFCMGKVGAGLHAFVVIKPGKIVDLELDVAGALPKARIVRTMTNVTLSEGCVVDDRTKQLYVSEEDVAIWRFDLAQPQPAPVRFATVDGETLVADSEGLAIAPKGADGGYLIASSQGDNAYTLYRLPDGAYAGRFRIASGAIDGASDTDGIELVLGDFGPNYPGGLFVAQDGDNRPEAQNFKLLAWDDIRLALGLPE